ncbi:MAG: hypothetical protein R3C68_01715 [Myxococcota bacterium]
MSWRFTACLSHARRLRRFVATAVSTTTLMVTSTRIAGTLFVRRPYVVVNFDEPHPDELTVNWRLIDEIQGPASSCCAPDPEQVCEWWWNVGVWVAVCGRAVDREPTSGALKVLRRFCRARPILRRIPGYRQCRLHRRQSTTLPKLVVTRRRVAILETRNSKEDDRLSTGVYWYK